MLDDDDITTGTGDGGADGGAEPGPEGPADGGAGTGDGGADGGAEPGPEGPADGGAGHRRRRRGRRRGAGPRGSRPTAAPRSTRARGARRDSTSACARALCRLLRAGLRRGALGPRAAVVARGRPAVGLRRPAQRRRGRRAGLRARAADAVPAHGQGRRGPAGRVVHPRWRCRRRRSPTRRPTTRCWRALADGSTLVLQGLHRTWPPLVDFGCAAGRGARPPRADQRVHHAAGEPGLRAPPRRPRRLRPAGRPGASTGPCTRRSSTDPLGNQSFDRFKRRDRRPGRASPPLIDTVLEPGDALYLPRGTVHSAQALGETSIHLTIGVHPLTRYDLVRLPAGRRAGRPARCARRCPWASTSATPTSLRRTSPRPWPPCRPRWRTCRRSASPSASGTNLMQRTRPRPVGPLAQLAAAEALADDTPLRMRGAAAGPPRARRRAAEADVARPHASSSPPPPRRRSGRILDGRGLHARRPPGPRRARPADADPPPAARGPRRAGVTRFPPRAGPLRRPAPTCAATRCSARPSRRRGCCSSSSRSRGGRRACAPRASTRRPRSRVEARGREEGVRVQAIRRLGRDAEPHRRRWTAVDTRDAARSASAVVRRGRRAARASRSTAARGSPTRSRSTWSAPTAVTTPAAPRAGARWSRGWPRSGPVASGRRATSAAAASRRPCSCCRSA